MWAFVWIHSPRIKPEKLITTIGPAGGREGFLSFGFLFCVLIFSIHLYWGQGFPWLASPYPRAFRSEIIWWNPCILTPLSHNEALQSKPLSLFLTWVSLATGGGMGVGVGGGLVGWLILSSSPHLWLTSTPDRWTWSDLFIFIIIILQANWFWEEPFVSHHDVPD